MLITPSQGSLASRLPQASHVDEPLASFEALSRRLRDAARERCALWLHSAEVAAQARRAGACDALITAALLHRLGDLVMPTPVDGAGSPSAAEIAHLGADLLVDLYPPLVTEPIRLHPPARRYLATVSLPRLCRADLAELGQHSDTLKCMSEAERACFAALPFAMNAVRLARWSLAVAAEVAERAEGKAAVERELPAFYRIAERSVCNDGFGWGG